MNNSIQALEALLESIAHARWPEYLTELECVSDDSLTALREAIEVLKLRESGQLVRVSPKELCEHGRGLTDYCEPCGRINGGG